MLLVLSERRRPVAESVVVTLGMFDGVHRGHAKLIETSVALARQNRSAACVHTFSNHPLSVLDAAHAPKLLSTAREKALLMQQMNVDALFMLLFTQETARMSEHAFFGQLHAQLHIYCVVVGYNYRFGRDGRGDAETVRRFGRRMGFGVEVLPPYEINGAAVSSTRVRAALAAGELDEAAQLCGRAYTLHGTVMQGKQVGRTIGVPTANIDVAHEKLLPANGVYVAMLEVESGKYGAVCNIGERPTFADGRGTTVEAHALDCRKNLYGQTAEVTLLARLRAEKKFADKEALHAQIEKDVGDARAYLKKNILFPGKNSGR